MKNKKQMKMKRITAILLSSLMIIMMGLGGCNKPEPEPEPLPVEPPAPKIEAPKAVKNLVLSPSGEGEALALSATWDAVEGADGYMVELIEVAQGVKVESEITVDAEVEKGLANEAEITLTFVSGEGEDVTETVIVAIVTLADELLEAGLNAGETGVVTLTLPNGTEVLEGDTFTIKGIGNGTITLVIPVPEKVYATLEAVEADEDEAAEDVDVATDDEVTKDDVTETEPVVIDTNETEIIFDGITDGLAYATEYTVIVGAYANDGDVKLSAEDVTATAITPVPPITSPELTATVVSHSQVNLSWELAENATGYIIECTDDIETGTWTFLYEVGADETTYTNSGLSANTVILYRIIAKFGDVAYEASEHVTATTPAAPVNPKPGTGGNNSGNNDVGNAGNAGNTDNTGGTVVDNTGGGNAGGGVFIPPPTVTRAWRYFCICGAEFGSENGAREHIGGFAMDPNSNFAAHSRFGGGEFDVTWSAAQCMAYLGF